MKKSVILWLGVAWVDLCVSFSVNAAVVQSGSCGGECMWELDDKGVFSTTNASTSDLTSFEIPEGTKTIANRALENMTSVTNLTIPSGVTSIGYYAFSGMSRVTNLNIPETVTKIYEGAFFHMRGLTGELKIPKSVDYIGPYTFRAITSDILISADGPLTDAKLSNTEIGNRIVRYTEDGKYIKGDKVYANLEDYRAGNYAVYDQKGKTYQKFTQDGEPLGKFNKDGTIYISKRIYTVEEAQEALGSIGKNTFSIRYR